MSKKIEKFTSGPVHFNAKNFFAAMTSMLEKAGVPFLDTHEAILEYDNNKGRKASVRAKITVEIVEDEQPAHEHLKEEANV